ncbi:TPA: site-specific DNA-methyltransferase [Burkholderia vietnamiensis]|nr:site-specific DNA-methyltransferase [Burkholderia vietnamiensis]
MLGTTTIEGELLPKLVPDIVAGDTLVDVKQTFSNHLINGDCVDVIRAMGDESVDLVIADPPYFQVCGDFDFGVFKNRSEYLAWCREWLLECKRVLKPTGSLILWGGVGEKEINIARLAILIEDEEILIRKNWITQRNSRGYGTKRNYMSAREDFLFLTKTEKYTFNIPYTGEKSGRKDLGANGKPRTNEYKRVSNVWNDITEASQSSIERCWHPTVKAQKLCDRIIETHSNEGDTVLVPFVGSGSEIISAINNKRDYVGIELDPEHFQKSVERIKSMAKVEVPTLVFNGLGMGGSHV